MATKERPSFSRYLRNVANLGAPNSLDKDSPSLEERMKWKNEKNKSDNQWITIRNYLTKHAPPKSLLKTKLENLRSFSKDLTGE
ncbi:hypothetical protein J437_LFUL013824, partial [Ladona fulva]